MFINKMFHDNSIFSLCTDEKWWSLQKSVNCFKSRVYVADNQTFFHRCCSATQLCPTLCSTPGFPVLHFTNPYPGVCSNSYPLSQWCYLTISSSAAPVAFDLAQHQSLPMSHLFPWGGQSTGASASVLPMSIQGQSPLGLTVLAVQGTVKSLLQHHSLKAPIHMTSHISPLFHSTRFSSFTKAVQTISKRKTWK